ncbi:MAG: AbrB family transcriptional regulator [Thermoprotei archaeon]|nr:MAG: AbrB family transcriptional regulator [Thermoprotei archaeon]HDD64441.1 AbrB/MazE/SpoVT family DNA-binding domain-containing protein [Thermoprotei archaeon]
MHKIRVGEKGVIYLPISIRRKLGIERGGELIVSVKEDYVVLKPIKTVFKIGAESEKITEITVEEFERESEEYQRMMYEE